MRPLASFATVWLCAAAGAAGALPRATAGAEDITSPTLHPQTGLPVWFRNATVDRTVGYPAFSIVMRVAGLVAPLPEGLELLDGLVPVGGNTSAPAAGNSSDGFVPPEEFQVRAVPSRFGTKRVVYMPHFVEGVTPPVTCDVLHAERVAEDTWTAVFVARESQTLAVVGCVDGVPVTPVAKYQVVAEDFVGLLPLAVTWSVGAGIGTGVILVLSRALRRGLVPVYSCTAQFISLVRVVVAPLYFMMLVDLWRGNAGWVADWLVGVYLVGVAVVVGVGHWWAHPSHIAAVDALTAPAVQGWAWAFRARTVVIVSMGAMGAHVMASLWSGILGLRMFQAPAGVWRRVPLLDLTLATVVLMDAPVVAAGVFTLLRTDADVAIPLICWPAAGAAGCAIIIEFIAALAAPLATDEAVLVTRLAGLYAMRREIQWLKRKETEKEEARRRAARERARLAVSGGAVNAEEKEEGGLTTVVRKVGVAQPSTGLTIEVEAGGAVRQADGKGMGGRSAPALVEEALAMAMVDGVGPEMGGELGLELDAAGGYSGALKPIPNVAGVRRDAVLYMRSVGPHAAAIPGVARADRGGGRGALDGGELDGEGIPSYRKEGVWGGNAAMEVVGRAVTPPEERRRRARREADRSARQKQRDERKRAKRQELMGKVSARMNEAMHTARSRGDSARGDGTARGPGAAAAMTGRSDFTAGGLMTERSTAGGAAAGGALTVMGAGSSPAAGRGRPPLAASKPRLPEASALPVGLASARRSARVAPSGSASTRKPGPSARGAGDATTSRAGGPRPDLTARSGDTGLATADAGASDAGSSRGSGEPGTTDRGAPTSRRSGSPRAWASIASSRRSARRQAATGSGGRSSPSASSSLSSRTGRSSAESRASPDLAASHADEVAALRAKRRDRQARRMQLSGAGPTGASGGGGVLPIPSTRMTTTSSRFLTGTGLGAAKRPGAGHWADERPIASGPSFGVAPGAPRPDAASSRVLQLKRSMRRLNGAPV